MIEIDIEVSDRARQAVASHPCGQRVTLLEGSSTDAQVLEQVRGMIPDADRVLVVLDADHGYAHVAEELRLYAPMVTPGSYLVATEGVMEVLDDAPRGRPEWQRDNPARAARDFLETRSDFVHEPRYERFGATFFPSGFLRRVPTDDGGS